MSAEILLDRLAVRGQAWSKACCTRALKTICTTLVEYKSGCSYQLLLRHPSNMSLLFLLFAMFLVCIVEYRGRVVDVPSPSTAVLAQLVLGRYFESMKFAGLRFRRPSQTSLSQSNMALCNPIT